MEIEKCLQKRWSFGRWLKIQSVPLVFLWYWYVRPFMKPFMATKNCHSFLAWQFMMTFFLGGMVFHGAKNNPWSFFWGELAIPLWRVLRFLGPQFWDTLQEAFSWFCRFFLSSNGRFYMVDMLWKWNVIVIFSRFFGGSLEMFGGEWFWLP